MSMFCIVIGVVISGGNSVVPSLPGITTGGCSGVDGGGGAGGGGLSPGGRKNVEPACGPAGNPAVGFLGGAGGVVGMVGAAGGPEGCCTARGAPWKGLCCLRCGSWPRSSRRGGTGVIGFIFRVLRLVAIAYASTSMSTSVSTDAAR
jgi:hypothetical protein